MAIILNNSCFMHIPKTGGNTIKKILQDNQLIQAVILPTHISLKPLQKITNLTIFTIIRNPINWYISRWAYTTNIVDNNKIKKLKHERIITGEPFYNYQDSPKTKLQLENFNVWLKNIPNSLYSNYMKEYLGKNFNETKYNIKLENLNTELKKTIKTLENKTINITNIQANKSDEKRKNKAKFTKNILRDILTEEKPFMEKFGYPTKLADYEKYLL